MSAPHYDTDPTLRHKGEHVQVVCRLHGVTVGRLDRDEPSPILWCSYCWGESGARYGTRPLLLPEVCESTRLEGGPVVKEVPVEVQLVEHTKHYWEF